MAVTVSSSLPILETCSNRAAGSECGWTELVTFFGQAIGFAIWITTILVVGILIYTGFKIMTSGSPEQLSKAKSAFGKILIGYFWMLCGWLVVKYILSTLGVSEDIQYLAPK